MGIPVIFILDRFGDYRRIGVYDYAGGTIRVSQFYNVYSSMPDGFFPHFIKQLTKKTILRCRMHEMNQQFETLELEAEKKKICHSLQVQIKKQLTKL